MNSIKNKYLAYFRNKDFIVSFLLSVAIIIISLIANFYSRAYATESVSNSVTDIILSNIRVYDVDGIFIYGPIFLTTFVAFILLLQPRRIPFTFKSVGLFVLIRSFFVSLTHISPFLIQAPVSFPGFFGTLASGGDLFFSGHTGIPFLLALLFWENIFLRIFFIVTSLIFGTVALLAHLHYSIDVLSAFFITYTIYHIAVIIFKKDKKVFDGCII
jgi:hypothetical protein